MARSPLPPRGLESPTTPEMRRVAESWERFVSGGDATEDVPEIVRRAWARSRELGVSPALPHAPRGELPPDFETLRRDEPWIDCSAPVVDFLETVLHDRERQMIVLADKEGRILLTRGGEEAVVRAAELGATAGGLWAEGSAGCTALGTCLFLGEPLQIAWQENYCESWHDWATQFAPVRDPMTEEIVGVLGVAGLGELLHPQALDLVVRATKMLETGLREYESKSRFQVLERFGRLLARYARDPLIALDRRGTVLALSPEAERTLGMPVAELLGRNAREIPSVREHLSRVEVRDEGRGAPQATSPASATMFVVQGPRRVGSVLLLPAPEHVKPRPIPSTAWTATHSFADLAGDSAVFRETVEIARGACGSSWPVLLLGESGTGKELFAQAIHNGGPRARRPFVTVSCAAVGDELIASELFGYSEGSFTGAVRGGKAGKIQLADGGTLFLDDIDGMSLRMQASLLRVLEEGRVVPLGASRPVEIDVRIVAACNADLEAMVGAGRFRHDLFHRLNVLAISLPPLRERAGDLPTLARHLLSLHAPGTELDPAALERLEDHAWPGNLRELRNVLVAAASRAKDGRIRAADLPPALRAPVHSTVSSASLRPERSLREAETEMILDALRASGSVAEAAERLGMHYSTLYRRLKKLPGAESLVRARRDRSRPA